MNAAEEINKIKQTYYWDSSLENLANWIVCALWTEWQTKDTDKEPYLEDLTFKYKEAIVEYNFTKKLFNVTLWCETESVYNVVLPLDSYLHSAYGNKTFKEVCSNIVFDIQELEFLSFTVAEDISIWIKNIVNVYEEVCAI
jgi:hypothetical protein